VASSWFFDSSVITTRHGPINIRSVMELGHLLTRSGLTYQELSSKVYHDSVCPLGNSVSLPWVIYFEAFNLHAITSFLLYSINLSKIGVIFNSFVICAEFVKKKIKENHSMFNDTFPKIVPFVR